MFNDRFYQVDGTMIASAMKKTQWMEEFYFAMKLTHQMLCTYYAEVTATMVIVLIAAHILHLSGSCD